MQVKGHTAAYRSNDREENEKCRIEMKREAM